jgi:flavodoxin
VQAVVVYESMYGNTHLIADAIARGLASACTVKVVAVGEADQPLLEAADLVVVGGPTHVHGMSRESTRKAAVEAADKPDSDLTLDPDAEGPGLREWFDQLGEVGGRAAAFDTRIDVAAAISGRASKGISKRLRRHGFDEVAKPESFLVTKETHLEPDEEARATAWGEQLAAKLG